MSFMADCGKVAHIFLEIKRTNNPPAQSDDICLELDYLQRDNTDLPRVCLINASKCQTEVLI